MTFIPNTLSKLDTNNSGTSTDSSQKTFTGTSTATSGYLSINIDIDASNNSSSNGLVVYTSNSSTSGFIPFFIDTYFANTNYQKTINLTGNYYKLSLNFDASSNYVINTYLNTDFNQDGANGVYLPSKIEAHYDAFGKLRVANPYTLLDLQFPPLDSTTTPTPTSDYLKNNLQIIYYNSANGSVTYTNSQAVITQTSTGNSISQSRKYGIYQPGKSLLFLASFIFNTTTSTSTDYTLRIGYFDDYNGIFLQYNKADTYPIGFVLRSNVVNTNTTPSNGTTYNQSVWNIDKLDGTGNSGIRLDFTKAQLMVIDLEWLSVGRIRCGFMCYGKIVYCHVINNINSLNGPYMYTADLPIRYQVVNNFASTTAGLTQICATVISEGGYRPSGNVFSAGTSLLSIAASTSEYTILSLTGNDNFYHNEVLLTTLSLCTTSNDILKYRIRLYLPDDPSAPTGLTYTDVASTSVVKYSTSNVTVTVPNNSIVLQEGYLLQNNNISLNQNPGDYIVNNNSITSNVANSSIGYIVITIQNTTSSAYTIAGSLNWTEF